MQKTFSSKERILLVFFLAVFTVGFCWWVYELYLNFTFEKPIAGGELVEGIVGSPRYINPVISDTSEGDAVLEALIFSSLFRGDTRGGIEPDLAESFNISENRKEYFVTLRDGIFWHDGESLSVDDVIFTVDLIKRPEVRSPFIVALENVIAVEKISSKTLKFALDAPNEVFLQNLTFRIMPKHIWSQVPIENMPLVEYNIRPIGSGPYRFKSFEKDKSGTFIKYTLSANPDYHHGRPFINGIQLKFFKDVDEVLLALKSRGIDALSSIPPDRVNAFDKSAFSLLRIATPRVYAVFFNTDAPLLKDSSIRYALVASVNKSKLVAEVIGENGEISYGPIPQVIPAALSKNDVPEYDLKDAITRLEKAGWRDSDGDGIRDKKLKRTAKEPTKLALKLLTPIDSQHIKTAQLLRDYWKAAGIEVEIESLDAAGLMSARRSRAYDMIFIGALIPQDPDLFPFWHSSQSLHPGLNLSRFSSRKVDELLSSARREPDAEKRFAKLVEAQKLIVKENPALFLYSPYFLYAIAPNFKFLVKPVFANTPEERFGHIYEWYIFTKRAWKR